MDTALEKDKKKKNKKKQNEGKIKPFSYIQTLKEFKTRSPLPLEMFIKLYKQKKNNTRGKSLSS